MKVFTKGGEGEAVGGGLKSDRSIWSYGTSCCTSSLECCGNRDFVDQQSVRRRRTALMKDAVLLPVNVWSSASPA